MTQEALKLALEALDNLMYWDNGKPDYDEAREAITAIKEALAQEQEPVAWVDPATLYQLKIGLEGVHLVYETEMVNSLPLYDKPQIDVGCAECGVNGGHALYCVACAEKFVGGYKDSGVPAVETGLEQVSPDTPPQRTWVGLTDVQIGQVLDDPYIAEAHQGHWRVLPFEFARAIEAKLKEKNT